MADKLDPTNPSSREEAVRRAEKHLDDIFTTGWTPSHQPGGERRDQYGASPAVDAHFATKRSAFTRWEKMKARADASAKTKKLTSKLGFESERSIIQTTEAMQWALPSRNHKLDDSYGGRR